MTGRSPRLLLGLASVAVAFAAADTYVVVLALPDMMTSVGVEVVAAPARRPDRLGLPARVRRDAAADRPDRRPARPGAGAGDGAGRVRARLAGDGAGLRHALDRGRPLPPGRRRRRAGPGDAGPGGRPLPGGPTRRPPRRGLGGPGARQRHRSALRRAGPLGVRLAGDLRDQPRRRPGPRRRDPHPRARAPPIPRTRALAPTTSARSSWWSRWWPGAWCSSARRR